VSDQANQAGRDYSFARHRLKGFNYHDADVAYFVTIRAREGSPFTNEELAQVVIDSLGWFRENRGIKLYAYVLMPDHLHVLLRLRDEGQFLGTIVSSFKSFTTKQSWKLGLKGPLWQERFYDQILRTLHGARKATEYILANPERRGLRKIGGEYRWSGSPDPM
jgi:REP element-mobilizing transposase RayT